MEQKHVREAWADEQLRLKQLLREDDSVQWDLGRDALDRDVDVKPLTRVAGVDISFLKGSNEHACASLVVLDYTSLTLLYEAFTYVSLPAPYIPGFLAFREVPALYMTLVDGNGILHPRGFGLASHFGVLMDIPTIGVGKTFLHVDGLTKGSVKTQMEDAKAHGDTVTELIGDSGKVWGAAVCGTTMVQNPTFVSVGHQVKLSTAVEVNRHCSKYRVPEPIRQADQRSRKIIREWQDKNAVDTTLDTYHRHA